jgi:DNA-binding NarL/FixJ family response regulator
MPVDGRRRDDGGSLSNRVALDEAHAESLWQVIETLPCGVLLFDSAGQLMDGNCVGRGLLDGAETVRLSANELAAMTLADARTHRTMLRLGEGVVALVARPLPAAAPDQAFPQRTAAIVIHMHRPLPPPCAATLQLYFPFTPAEAALAAVLAAGLTTEAAADRLGITINTCRTRVKQLLSKTSTRSQGELIALLLSAPSP